MPAVERDEAPRALPSFLEEQTAQPAQRAEQPPPVPRVAQPAFDSAKQLEHHFIGALVEALGVERASYLDITGDVFSAALSAAEAFRAVQITNAMLNRLVEQRLDEAKDVVDQMHDRLMEAPEARTALGPDALQVAYDDVQRNLLIIALLPGGPIEALLKRLADDLDEPAGAGKLSVEELEMLRLVRRLAGRLANAGREDADAWLKLQAGFIQDHPAAGQFAVAARNVRRQQR